MKTIKYTLGIIAMVVTFSSCTIEELELASDSQNTTTEQVIDSPVLDKGDEIDPPVIPTKP